MIRIRRARTLEDELALVLLQREILPHDQPLPPDDGMWWLAFDDQTPVAFACLKPSAQWEETGYLARAGVLPSHRGQGLQRRLIRVRCRAAKRLGWGWCVTDTRDNPASARSLIAEGFRPYRPRAPWGFRDTTYWRRRA